MATFWLKTWPVLKPKANKYRRGVRVHLGYLYYSQGRDNEARALLEQEREVFPESQVFIDGLLARLGTQ